MSAITIIFPPVLAWLISLDQVSYLNLVLFLLGSSNNIISLDIIKIFTNK